MEGNDKMAVRKSVKAPHPQEREYLGFRTSLLKLKTMLSVLALPAYQLCALRQDA